MNWNQRQKLGTQIQAIEIQIATTEAALRGLREARTKMRAQRAALIRNDAAKRAKANAAYRRAYARKGR